MKLTRTKNITIMTLEGAVTDHDIINGQCLLQARCMYKVATARTLLGLEKKSGTGLGPNTHHVRVDGQFFRFNFRGYRWKAPTPKLCHRNLLKYDIWGKSGDRRRGAPCPVKPHSFKIKAERTSKIRPISRERQDQVNAARRERVAQGLPDKEYKGRTFRQRIAGIHIGTL
jgi:hypothetical protein